MSHRSKLYGMYEEEGEFDAIMGMSKADELFLKLGYEERPPEVDVQTYVNPKLKSGIQFWTTCDKGISFYGDHIIDKEEIKTFLQAINEKCKELGWLDMTKYICDRCKSVIDKETEVYSRISMDKTKQKWQRFFLWVRKKMDKRQYRMLFNSSQRETHKEKC